jgi:hypothetical protein
MSKSNLENYIHVSVKIFGTKQIGVDCQKIVFFRSREDVLEKSLGWKSFNIPT